MSRSPARRRHQGRGRAALDRRPSNDAPVAQTRPCLGTVRRRRENRGASFASAIPMIRKLKSGEYRLYSRKKDAATGKRKNLGTFKSRAAAEKHERAVQFFKR